MVIVMKVSFQASPLPSFCIFFLPFKISVSWTSFYLFLAHIDHFNKSGKVSESSSLLRISSEESFQNNQFMYTYVSLCWSWSLSHNHTHSHTLQELTQCKSSARANHATSKAASFYIQSQSELVSAEERDCFTALLMSKSPSNSHTHITISRVSDSDVSLIPSALCPPPRASDWDMAVWWQYGSPSTRRLGHGGVVTVQLTASVYLHAWLRAPSRTWQEYQNRGV